MLNHKPILQLFYILILGRYMIEAKPFRPAARLAHSSALVGTKLYFFGGYAIFYTSYEVFYLDLSEPFIVTAPPWKDISNSSGMPFRNAWGTTALVNNPDNEEDSNVYLIGGIMRDKENSELVFSSHAYMFNTSSGRWSIPEIKGTVPEARRNVKAVVDDVGKIYILCGYSDYLTGSETNHIIHELVSLNTKDLTWSSEAMENAPRRRDHYTATWLPNGTIVYIGGREFVGGLLTEADINRIHLYDTKKSTWSVMRAVSKNPIGHRFLHTAVLAPGDRIIICGGAKTRPGVRNFRVAPDIAVLNTRTSPFEWTVPQVSSEVGEIPTLAAHTANLVGYYMIATFGNVTEPDTLPLRANSKVYILDIRSFTWVNKFEPISAQSPLYSESFNNSTDNTDNKMFTVIGGILGVVLIGLLYVWSRREKKVKKK